MTRPVLLALFVGALAAAALSQDTSSTSTSTSTSTFTSSSSTMSEQTTTEPDFDDIRLYEVVYGSSGCPANDIEFLALVPSDCISSLTTSSVEVCSAEYEIKRRSYTNPSCAGSASAVQIDDGSSCGASTNYNGKHRRRACLQAANFTEYLGDNFAIFDLYDSNNCGGDSIEQVVTPSGDCGDLGGGMYVRTTCSGPNATVSVFNGNGCNAASQVFSSDLNSYQCAQVFCSSLRVVCAAALNEPSKGGSAASVIASAIIVALSATLASVFA